MWQDVVITIGSVIFAMVLIPQLKDCIYSKAVVNVWSASLTSFILFIFCICYASLGMWLAALPLTAIMWALIAGISYKNSKLKPIC